MICQFGDVVVVLFPFTDLNVAKPRPAVALSSEAFSTQHGQTIFAMVTTGAGSNWPTDVAIADLPSAGLQHPSVVRWKLFTLVNGQIATRIGRLAKSDRDAVASAGRIVLLA